MKRILNGNLLVGTLVASQFACSALGFGQEKTQPQPVDASIVQETPSSSENLPPLSDPTQARPELRQFLEGPRAEQARPTVPTMLLKARMSDGRGNVVVILEINRQLHFVRQGSRLTLGRETLRVVAASEYQLQVEFEQLGETVSIE